MQLSHTFPVASAGFDDPNLVSAAGLVPVMRLAERCALHELATDTLTLTGPGSANPAAKVMSLLAGMVAGADSIDDMDVLRHGGMDQLFDQVRAPSTLGTFLRGFTFGHVRQLDKVAAGVLTTLSTTSPLLREVDQVCFIDVDDTIRQTYGYAKQGAGYGYSGVKGINALIGTISTPLSSRRPGSGKGRRTRPGARPGWSPTCARPPDRSAAEGWWCCGRTRPTTTPTWSPPHTAAEPPSPSRHAWTGPY